MQNSDQIPEKLSFMLSQVESSDGFKKFIKKIAQKMNFDKKNILNLTKDKVETLYKALKSKIENASYPDEQTKNCQNSIWLENQLRIFIYIMCMHLFLNKMQIHELKSEDYYFMHEFFPNKKPQHLEYQVKLLVCNKNIKWSNQQSKLFREIMKLNHQSKRWNYIAKELFIRSNKKYFKTPKQCRERWINHQDPSKIKESWQSKEDLTLLSSVLNYGKKWTLISHELNDTRTQNSVKNRYNSLIKYAKKTYGYDKTQQILIDLLIQKRQVQQNKLQIESDEKLKVEQPKNVVFNQQQKIVIKQNQQKKQLEQTKQEALYQNTWKIQQQAKPLKIIQIQKEYKNRQDFKYVFDQSQELQNIVWHSSETPYKMNDQFYFLDGNYCLEEENCI